MYYIYKIGYQISDEINLRKENEKPFYWEQIHPEIRDKSIEEVDQYLIGGGLSEEKLKEMTKNEKYMAVSEGLYAAELAEKTAKLEQFEQTAVIDSESSFLNNPNTPAVNNGLAGTPPKTDEPPITGTESTVVDEDFTPLAIGTKTVTQPGQGTEPVPNFDEPLPGNTTPGKTISTPVPSTGSPGGSTGGAVVSSSVKRDSMVIVKNAVDQMNQVERSPDEQAALVQSVIDELKNAKESLYK